MNELKTITLLLLALSSITWGQMTTVGRPENPTAAIKVPALPAVSAETKLALRDIQVQSFALSKTLTDAREQLKQLELSVNEQQNALGQQWMAVTQKALTDAKLDPAKYEVQTGKEAKDIVFAAKEITGVISPKK
ncbi:MAG: hypothetical protein C5B44_05685 [Acidobacteria bacterium]|nr:MAG: hypothetical protein C5B44_05685 [Acidobacteriota bacterium]